MQSNVKYLHEFCSKTKHFDKVDCDKSKSKLSDSELDSVISLLDDPVDVIPNDLDVDFDSSLCIDSLKSLVSLNSYSSSNLKPVGINTPDSPVPLDILLNSDCPELSALMILLDSISRVEGLLKDQLSILRSIQENLAHEIDGLV